MKHVLMGMLLTGCSSGKPPELFENIPQSTEEPPELFEDIPQPTNEVLQHETVQFSPTGDLVEITEKMFIAQTNDIYINSQDYIGKTVKYEGIFKKMTSPEFTGEKYFVIRYGPGCCGYDGEAGFEVYWDGPYAEENDWCEAVGVIETYDINGWIYLRVALTSLKVLDVRGEETVLQ